MQTLNNIAESIFLGFSDEPFKMSVHYESKGWDSQVKVFDSVSDDDKEWSAFKKIYGECRVTMLEIDFREYKDGKNRITLHLLMVDTMKIQAKKNKRQAINEEENDNV